MTYLAQGILSANLIHGIVVAAAKDIQATKDGFTLPAIDRIANVAVGRNLNASIHTRLQKKSDLPSPFTVNIPFKDGNHPSGILLPHELFAALYQHPGFWKVAMVPDDAKLPELWTATQPSNNTLSNTSLGGEPMGCPWCFMVMKCQLLELAKSGPGHLCVFLIAPYLPMQWVVPWTTSSCIVGLSLRSFVCQVLHFFWVQWTLSSRSCSGPFRPCTWGFGQIQTGQGACITTALLKVGKLELLWLEVILVCCCN